MRTHGPSEGSVAVGADADEVDQAAVRLDAPPEPGSNLMDELLRDDDGPDDDMCSHASVHVEGSEQCTACNLPLAASSLEGWGWFKM